MRRVFNLAVLVALVHALDDAFVHRGPGLGLGQHALAGILAAASAAAGIALYPRLRPVLRAALAFAFGALAIVNGAMHVNDPTVTGMLVLAAGIVLVALAPVILWRERERGTGRDPRASRGVRAPRRGVLRLRLETDYNSSAMSCAARAAPSVSTGR